MSSVPLWALVAYFAVDAVVVIAMIGKPRKTIDPVTAIINLIVGAVFIVSLFVWGN